MKEKHIRTDELKNYLEESRGLERDYISELVKSRRIAWIFAYGFGVLGFLGFIAGIFGLFQSAPPPFILRVDNATGAVERVSIMREHEDSYEETVDEYWLNQYILNRENYDYDSIQINYDTTLLFSSSDVQHEYKQLFKGPHARDAVLKNKAKIITLVRSIQINGKGQATVYFTVQQVNHNDIKLPPEHLIATIGYQYVNAPMTVSDRRINPLGFQVTSYRTSPEILHKN